MASGGPPTVEWFKNDKALQATTPTAHTVAKATQDDNGEYKCTVTFGKFGAQTSSTVTQYVRYVTPDATVYGVQQTDIDIVCTFYGDALGVTSWLKGDTPVTTGGQYTVTAGTYASQMRTDTLTIKTLTSTNDGVYTCKASYTATTTETSSKQTLSVIAETLTVSTTRTPATAAIDQGTKVTFTCTYTARTMEAGDGDITVAWKMNGEPLGDSAKAQFEVTADNFRNGVFKCDVTYGKYGVISSSNTLLVRSVSHDTNVYAMNGEKVTLTCKAYGDEPTTVTWNDGTKDFTKADAEVTDTAYANYYVESAFVITSATSTKSYTCKVDYASPTKSDTKTTALKVLKAISEFLNTF